MMTASKNVPVAGFPTVVVEPTAKELPDVVLYPISTLVSAVSVAVAAAQVAARVAAVVLTTTLPGHVILGSSLSSTVTVKLQALLLLAASVAVYVTVVTPIGNSAPLTRLFASRKAGATPLLSATLGRFQVATP
jgi:hypothetical protein